MKLLLLCFLLTSFVSMGKGVSPNVIAGILSATTNDVYNYATKKGKLIQDHYQRAKDGPKKKSCHDKSSDKMNYLQSTVETQFFPCMGKPNKNNPGSSSVGLDTLKQCLGKVTRDYKKALDKVETDTVSCLKGQ